MNQSDKKPERYTFAGALLGAIFIHPIAIALAWLRGLIFGASVPMAPTPTYRDGINGGLAGIEELFFIYLTTLGVVPLIVSIVGAGIGVVVARLLGKTSAGSEPIFDFRNGIKAPVQLTAIWACTLFIVECGIQYVVFLNVESFAGGGLGTVLILSHLSIWILGVTLAILKHNDMRVAIGLIATMLLLPLVSPWLPRFVLPAASIAILLFYFSQRMATIPRENSGKLSPSPDSGVLRLNGFALFALGGCTFYTAICLYCGLWAMSLPAGSEDWGPGMVLILGAWGVPVFGGIAPIFRRQLSQLQWLTPRIVWVVVASELCICLLGWLSVVFSG